MFSPSLLAMMRQSLFTSAEVAAMEPHLIEAGNPYDVAQELLDMLAAPIPEMPSIPVVARTNRRSIDWQDWFPWMLTDAFDDGPYQFLWGRIPVDQLVRYFNEFRDQAGAEDELFDLGTTLRACGSGSSFDSNCANLLAQTSRTQPATVNVAIVDRGQTQTGQTPDDYCGKLRHTVTKDIVLSEHAEQVLSTLLDRLDHHGILPEIQMNCALVREPGNQIGPACFRHANAVELLDALKALRHLIARDKLPSAINISMGTHVGPHNGDSPLEDYIARLGNLRSHRFVHAAAGNDGLSGVAAVKNVQAGIREYFGAAVSKDCTDLLIEFWWHDPKQSHVELQVDVQDPSGQQTHTRLRIDSASASRTLKTAISGSTLVAKSLYHAPCRNQMSCVAFAFSPTMLQKLPAVNLQIAVDSTDDIIMHAWIVVCEGAQGMFVDSDSSATIMVPATAPGLVSVAGLDYQGRPWARSSRGPSVFYRSPPPRSPWAPSMAHRADLGRLGRNGTSIASPRACADTANVIRARNRLRNCGTILGLLCESYGLQPTPSPPWNPRTGYAAVTK